MYRTTLLVLLTLSLSHHVFALKILVIFSLPLRSHYMACDLLFRELANRGHSVTVLNNYPEEKPAPNLTFIDLTDSAKSASFEYMSPLTHYEKFSSWYLHLYNFYRHFELSPTATKRDCENLLTNVNVTANFAKKTRYDVIFVEQFMGDCGLAYAAALYDAPIIGITSHVLLPLSYARMGIPFDFSSDSFYFGNGGPNPSLYHKVEAFLLYFFYNTIGRIYYIQRDVYDVFNRHLPNNSLDIEKAARERIKMMFVYQHFSLTGARLLPPQVLEIGGIHIDKPKPVPEAVERFLSNAHHGAIYVGFGSNIKTKTMSKNKLQQFLHAFKTIPQKVIFKYEVGIPIDYDKEKIYVDSWFPQLDILCHPKVVAFVSHGGMLGTSEAAHCGKPVLVVPFFADQFSNAAAVRSVGLGRVLFFDHLDAESLAKEILELTSQEMQQNAKRVSKEWHDRPTPVMESAIYWTEYVARHGAMPPPLPSQRSAWYQTLLLDVAAVLIVLLLSVISLLYFVFKILKSVYVKPVRNQKSKSE